MDVNVESDTETPQNTETPENTEKGNSSRSCLILILAVSAVWGFCIGLLPDESNILYFVDYAAPIAMLVCALVWCTVDSARYDFFLTRRWYLFLLAFFVVAFPYYIFVTRGLAGLKIIAYALVFVAICAALLFISAGLGALLATVAFDMH